MTNNTPCDLIMLALPRWDGPYSSTAYSMAKALSVHSRVFYIDNPFMWKDFFRDRKSDQVKRRKKALLFGRESFIQPDANFPNLIAVTPRLMLSVNWLPKGKLHSFFSRINDAILEITLKKVVKEYALKEFIFINSFNPAYGRFFSSSFSPNLTIYHSVDDISESAYVAKHGVWLEEIAIRKADLTLVTSTELKLLKSGYSDNIVCLPNAADVMLFQRAVHENLSVPDEIRSIVSKRKIITYAGNICHRLDYELLVKLANRHTDKVLVMIGPFANDNYKKFGLDKLPNVIFTGRKRIDELPAYFKYSDCCIIPFLCIPLTRSIYPLKINEYLSAGKPVVTTNFSVDIANFESIAYVSNSLDAFIDNVGIAIETDTMEKQNKRVTYSSENSWTARAIQFWDIIHQLKRK